MLELFSTVDICSALTNRSIWHFLTFGRRLLQQLWPWLVQLAFFLDALLAINVSRRVFFAFRSVWVQANGRSVDLHRASNLQTSTVYVYINRTVLSITSSVGFEKRTCCCTAALITSINHKPNLDSLLTLTYLQESPVRWQDMSFSGNGAR